MNICAKVWKTRGTIPNPNAAVANQPAMINIPGLHLYYVFEQWLELI
jgi:hypothetical protein